MKLYSFQYSYWNQADLFLKENISKHESDDEQIKRISKHFSRKWICDQREPE